MKHGVFAAILVATLIIMYTIVLGTLANELLTSEPNAYESPSARVITLITTIGGLISALVVSQLSLTPRGEIPTFSPRDSMRNTTRDSNNNPNNKT